MSRLQNHADTVRGIMRDIDVVLMGFLHGSVIICTALAVFERWSVHGRPVSHPNRLILR